MPDCISCMHQYISTDSHHQLWRQSGKPYDMPVNLDCDVQESEVKAAQLAQQDAELAAAKQELASRLAGHQDCQRVRPPFYVHILPCKTLSTFQASHGNIHQIVLYMCNDLSVLSATSDLQEIKDNFDQLQEQLTQRGIELHAAKEQLVNLQKRFAGKCNEVTKGKQERATLQSSHHATLKASIHCARTPLPPASPPPAPHSTPFRHTGCCGVKSVCALWRQWQAIFCHCK